MPAADMLGVPREDGSLMLVNMAGESRQAELIDPLPERFSGAVVSKTFEVTSQMAAWVG
jgi:hypothetical protein